MQPVERPEARAEPANPVASELVVTSLQSDAPIQVVLQMGKEPSRDAFRVVAGQLASSGLTGESGEELHFGQVLSAGRLTAR